MFNTDETFSDYEISIMIVLIYPSKGIEKSKKKGFNEEPACQKVYDCLKKREENELFRKIFENNHISIRK